MSSTNRSDARKEHVSDYYITPTKPIMQFLENCPDIISRGRNLKVLDCCAGGCKNFEMSYPKVLNQFFISNIDTIDFRLDSRAKLKADYLLTDCKDKYDLIITNPPFNMAIEIIEKALEDAKEGGFVVMLLRLNFFGSDKRFKFWQENMPKYAFVHSKRLSFTDDGKTDSIEYMHCVWQKGYKPDYVKLKVI